MMGDDATIRVNIFGYALSVIYTCVFYYYTPMDQKLNVWSKMGMAAAFAACLIGYTQIEDPKVVEFRYGLILTGILYLLIASPLFGLVRNIFQIYYLFFVSITNHIYRVTSSKTKAQQVFLSQ